MIQLKNTCFAAKSNIHFPTLILLNPSASLDKDIYLHLQLFSYLASLTHGFSPISLAASFQSVP